MVLRNLSSRTEENKMSFVHIYQSLKSNLFHISDILRYSHIERQRQRQNPSGTGKTHRAAVAAA